jgi:hypothetical protein
VLMCWEGADKAQSRCSFFVLIRSSSIIPDEFVHVRNVLIKLTSATIMNEIREATPRLRLVGAFPRWKHTKMAFTPYGRLSAGIRDPCGHVLYHRRSRLVPIISTLASPEPMVAARLGQMVTLSPRWLAEQPLRVYSKEWRKQP